MVQFDPETDTDISENSQLLFDGQRMDWEPVPGSDIYGPLKDGNTDRQLISRVRRAIQLSLIHFQQSCIL